MGVAPKSVRLQSSCQYIIMLLGSTRAKAVSKMLMKLTPFLYEHCFGSFFSSYMYIEKAAKTTLVRKICTYNVDEIDTWLMKFAPL